MRGRVDRGCGGRSRRKAMLGNRTLYLRRLSYEALEARRLLAGNVLRVDVDSIATVPDGANWQSAYVSLQSALDRAAVMNAGGTSQNDVSQIWIAEGTYIPTALSDADLNGAIDTNPRSATFSLLKGVSLYGGFAGTESTLDERQLANDGVFPHETILSGDLGRNDAVNIGTANLLTDVSRKENAYTVVTAIDLAQSATLDGLTITGGNANGLNPSYASPTRDGGGIYHSTSSTLTVSHSIISRNSADSMGGGICNYAGTLVLTNLAISGNAASSYGGGIANGNFGTVTITNSTFSGNAATGNSGSGGGIYNPLGTVTITSSTISGNSANGAYSEGGGISNRSFDAFTITNFAVALNESTSEPNLYGSMAIGSGFNMVGVDPVFVRSPGPGADATWGTADDDWGDLHLTDRSPAVNMGNNALLPEGLAVDHDGNMRVFGDRTDIGALEYQADPPPGREVPSTIVTTATDTVDLYDGLVSLREAISHSALAGGRVTFDTSLDGREIVLDGDAIHLDRSITIDASDLSSLAINGDHRSRVFTVHTGSAALVGMTIIGGYEYYGGGIYNYGTLAVANSTISGNSATSTGGGICNYGTLTVTNSIISGNSAQTGGGIQNIGALIVTSSTLSGNWASSWGGAISSRSSGTLTITNSIVALNEAPSDPNVEGAMAVGSGSNLIGVDPAFVRSPSPGADATWGTIDDDQGDVHLTDCSPAINTSDNLSLPEGVTFDYDGEPPVFGGQVDIGVYEYQVLPPSGREVPSTVVTSAADAFDLYDGLMSLREAVWYAASIGNTVIFASSLAGQKIVLAGTDIHLDHPVTIDASNHALLTISGGRRSRVFTVHAANVQLMGMGITGGDAYRGGGLLNYGTLTVTNMSI